MTRPDDDLILDPHLDLDAAAGPGGYLEPIERDLEAPLDDVAEQAAAVTPVEGQAEVSRGWEVGEWDAVEQALVVDLAEDDEYR